MTEKPISRPREADVKKISSGEIVKQFCLGVVGLIAIGAVAWLMSITIGSFAILIVLVMGGTVEFPFGTAANTSAWVAVGVLISVASSLLGARIMERME